MPPTQPQEPLGHMARMELLRGHAERMHALYAGLERAHGKYELTGEVRPDGKAEGVASTMMQPPTVRLWELHLTGAQGLGVVPIRDGNDCLWGALDIDSYKNFDLIKLESRVNDLKIRAAVCRTKSGGAHVYVYTSEPVKAKLMREKLHALSVHLGYEGSEIFPKQDALAANDIGNWINMPYYGGPKTQRWAIRNGVVLSVGQFLDYAEAARYTAAEFEALSIESASTEFIDAPPCLLNAITAGIGPNEGRNNLLFSMGVFARMKYPDTWKERLDVYNGAYLQEPLPAKEVLTVIRTLGKKEYFYRCSEVPIKQYCNKPTCRTKRYGIGNVDELPFEMGNLFKYNTIPPTWYVDIEIEGRKERLKVDTDALIEQPKFRRVCMEVLNTLPPVIKGKVWETMIQERLRTLTLIEAPEDARPEGRLEAFFNKYIARTGANTRDGLLRGKHWVNDEDKLCYFLYPDFKNYLQKERFYDVQDKDIWHWLRAVRKAKNGRMTIGKKQVSYWSVEMPTGDAAYELPEDKGMDLTEAGADDSAPF